MGDGSISYGDPFPSDGILREVFWNECNVVSIMITKSVDF